MNPEDIEAELAQLNAEDEQEERAANIVRAVTRYTIRIVVFLVCLLIAQRLSGCAWNQSPCWHPQVEFNCRVV